MGSDTRFPASATYFNDFVPRCGMLPISPDGRQELSLVERLRLSVARDGVINTCQLHGVSLEFFKRYTMVDGKPGRWRLEGYCPKCDASMHVSPSSNRLPRVVLSDYFW